MDLAWCPEKGCADTGMKRGDKMEKITLGYGDGGKLSEELIKSMIKKIPGSKGDVKLSDTDDGGTVYMEGKTVVATDSHIVKPLFFPGGDIGKLAAAGTINDVAVMGAEPEYLTFSLVIEEGTSSEKLQKIVESFSLTCKDAGVTVVSGDTKVVPRDDFSGVMINTTGIGKVFSLTRDSGARPGDKIIINGGIGEHGVAVMAERDDYSFSTDLESDVEPLNRMIQEVVSGTEVHAMKDPTRGGISMALNEIAEKSGYTLKLDERKIPINKRVQGACSMLGLDPMELANEGKVIMTVSDRDAEKAVETMRREGFENARIIGEVVEGDGKVTMETSIGGEKIINKPSGLALPRIC